MLACVFILAGLLATLFEIAKHVLFPQITFSQSHTATILLVSIVVTICAGVLYQLRDGSQKKLNMESAQRKHAECELWDQMQRLSEMERILNRSPVVVFLWRRDAHWTVEYVSENVKTLTGYSAADFYSGRIHYANVVFPEDLPRVSSEVAENTNAGKDDFSQIYRIVTKNGKVRWIDDKTWTRKDAQGNITHYQGLVLDVTHNKETEQKLSKLQKLCNQSEF